MTRLDTSPFMKTSGRGGAYCTKGGDYWIIKSGSSWHLIQMARPDLGRERQRLGVFATREKALAYYREEVAR
jgi:hypothetical protein